MAIDLFSIGPVTFHGYGLMIGLGFLAGILAGSYIAKIKGLSADHFTNIAIWTLIIGFMGGKLLYIIVNFKRFLESPIAVLGSEGFVVYGGIITGVLTIIVYSLIKKLNPLDYLDLVAIAAVLNQAFGRIGCFCAGCCYGRQTDSAIGVIFPEGCIAPAGVKLLPTQLFMAAGDFLIFFLLVMITKSKKANIKGLVCGCYLLMYSIGRFAIEFARDDYERGHVGILSTSQFIAIWIALAAIVYIQIIVKADSNKSKSEQNANDSENSSESDSTDSINVNDN